tara:strand:- start:1383 stop:2057 length:675 start_codon:yes stop_codon:yes gene_type:complete
MSEHASYILSSHTVAYNNTENSYTWTNIPSGYDILEFVISGEYTQDTTSGASSGIYFMNIEMNHSWEAGNSANDPDVKNSYIYTTSRQYNSSQYAVSDYGQGASYPCTSGKCIMTAANNPGGAADSAFGWTARLIGNNSPCYKQIFWDGVATSYQANSYNHRLLGAAGFNGQANDKTRAEAKASVSSLRVSLPFHGTYNSSTSPTWMAGTNFMLIGYPGVTGGW